MNDSVYTISELNQFIKDVINAGFPQVVWICGEIQQYNRNKSKRHVFFELVEKDEKSKDVLARIGLVIFQNRKSFIEDMLKKSENAFELKDDIEVKFACRVDFYPPHGAVRLIVENIDPTYTLGRMAQEKQKLIALLKEGGVLDKNKQIALPRVPLVIGLISSYESAAYNDFLSELKKSGIAFHVYFRNALMQGKNAAPDICAGLKQLNGIKGLDLIVITRGGGSIADLSCFDNQQIAESIAASDYAVLSGIGHEIDLTITDLAAHTFAKTPTAIAQFLVERIIGFLDDLVAKRDRILELSRWRLEKENQKVRDLALDIQTATLGYLKDHQEQLIRIKEQMAYKPLQLLKDQEGNIAGLGENLLKVATRYLSDENNKVKSYAKFLTAVDPLNTLRRGFSITKDSHGKIIKGIEQVSPKEQMTTHLADGTIISEILNTRKGGKHGGY